MTLIHPLLITLPNFEGFSPNQEEGSTPGGGGGGGWEGERGS